MTLGNTWVSVFEAIRDRVSALTDAAGNPLFETVLEGWKVPYKGKKTAVILPVPDPIVPASVAKSSHTFKYQILIILESADTVVGMKEAMRLAGSVHDDLVANRTLGGLVDNLEATLYEMEWRVVRGVARHYVTLHVDCHLMV